MVYSNNNPGLYAQYYTCTIKRNIFFLPINLSTDENDNYVCLKLSCFPNKAKSKYQLISFFSQEKHFYPTAQFFKNW